MMVNYFLVFQRNPYYKHERGGGYLWAPMFDKRGQTPFHWNNMKIIKKGDIIFSSHQRKIVSVNIALSDYFEARRPKEFAVWEDMGWMAYVEYIDLDPPIDINKHIDSIKTMLPDKYSPFNVAGRGAQGYLFEINPELANYILYLAETENSIKDNLKISEEQEKTQDKTIEDIDDLLNKTTKITEKERIVKTRVGQGLFKGKLLALYDKCLVCGLSKKDLLIGSHIKPWRISSKEEKLNVNNGLLMCPGHDAIFDKGYITFNDNGKIIISSSLNTGDCDLLGIDENIVIESRPEQAEYLKWHRINVFKS